MITQRLFSAISFFIGPALGIFPATAQAQPIQSGSVSSGGFHAGNIERPLRYTPVGTDFVITNGAEFFNRPLYGGSSAFRVDGGDKPEFSLYLPGRGGNLRWGIKAGDKTKWLSDAAQVVTIYRPGSIIHEIRDPLLGDAVLRLTTLAPENLEAVILRAEITGKNPAAQLVWAFGGVNGLRGRRDGDIGCEELPVSRFFQLRPDQCADNVVTIAPKEFRVTGKPGTVRGVVSERATMQLAAAENWNHAENLFQSSTNIAHPVLAGRVQLKSDQPFYLALQRLPANAKSDEALAVYREVSEQSDTKVAREKPASHISPGELPTRFAKAEATRHAIAERLTVDTPDPFVNASVAALNIAEDAVWDDRSNAYLHGGVAWRTRLLGWRVSYAGDVMGAHDRTAKHFAGFARQQNTNPIPVVIPAPEESANLSRNELALHSNGDMTKSHYDMNMVGVDAFFRHLLWTGDLEFARRMWPTIERHLAWERRLFRREFGADKLPLYEAYACIWASDDLAYNGGGGTHSSAYNLYHNRMAARVAKLLGKDATLYEREAALIERGMKENLWLADRGWFAEWKDLLGHQLTHPNAAAWTFYHTVDSEVPTPLEAWQMTRFVDTQIARFPLRGPGVPAGNFTMPTTSWLPYTWSLNNVVLGETMYSALAYWQANRPEEAFPLLKGAVLDSMYLGLCPGNVGMCTWFDATRRESQRDFGDGVGAMSRAVMEGLFGVKPDVLAGEIVIRPGFPADWRHANIRHHDFQFSYQRENSDARETYMLESKFTKPLRLRLEVAAWADRVEGVTVNGHAAQWRMLADSVGLPRIEIQAPAAKKQVVTIEWRGAQPVVMQALKPVELGAEVSVKLPQGEVTDIADPQRAVSALKQRSDGFTAVASGTPGYRTVFAQVKQGDLAWWLPITFEIASPATPVAPIDWQQPLTAPFEPVDLSSHFNDSVTQIFKNEYRTPRSPYCSLATPKQGIGSWCHPKDTFNVNDGGLRARAAQAGGQIILPNGVPLATPGQTNAHNIAFVSQWDNYPREISVPLTGKSSHAFLLMAGSTDAMKSRFDNGEVIVTYTDGSTTRLPLRNPTTWWPIDQDYYFDDFAFRQNLAGEPIVPLPPRVNLTTGQVRVLNWETFKGKGRVVPGGAATVLDLPLDPAKELKTLTVRAIANEVVIGLMSVTLQR